MIIRPAREEDLDAIGVIQRASPEASQWNPATFSINQPSTLMQVLQASGASIPAPSAGLTMPGGNGWSVSTPLGLAIHAEYAICTPTVCGTN